MKGEPDTNYQVTSAHFTIGPDTVIRRAELESFGESNLLSGRTT